MEITTTLKNQKGFSLLEILVAIFLVMVILSTFTIGTGVFSPHQKLEETLDNIDRAIRFASDEAAIRNTIVRINFDLDKEPQEFRVEFSQDTNFILSKGVANLGQASSISEQEEEERILKKVNQQFSAVEEFSDEALVVPDLVRIQGIGSSLTNSFIQSGQAAIYFYPTGEKDQSIIILSTELEISTLITESFGASSDEEYINIENEQYTDLEDYLAERSRKIFEDWIQ